MGLAGPGQVRLTADSITRGRLVVDVLQGGEGEGFAGVLLVEGGRETLRLGVARQGGSCRLVLTTPGWQPSPPEGWNPDCRLLHRLVVDTFTGRALVAVDSLWVYATDAAGRFELAVTAGAEGGGEVALREVFLGGR